METVAPYKTTSDRVPTAAAQQAAAEFAVLSQYFRRRSGLAEALDWSLPTRRAWEAGRPHRPRAGSVSRVHNLFTVCQAAQRWVADPLDVGDWVLAFQPALQTSPADILLRLGSEGATALTEKMAFIAPHERVAVKASDVSEDELRNALARLGVQEIPHAARAASDDVDLSDFDA